MNLVERMFARGLHPKRGLVDTFQAQSRKTRSVSAFISKARKIGSYIRERRLTPAECGYVYFQEYVPDNDLDTRVTIIGDRAFSFNRLNRKGDFRASGSGKLIYPEPTEVDLEVVKIAFGISYQLGFQSMAYDFVTDKATGRRLLTEISYIFEAQAVRNCQGYFDGNFRWNAGSTWPQDAILDDVLTGLASGQGGRSGC
jgi:hypothetical protein